MEHTGGAPLRCLRLVIHYQLTLFNLTRTYLQCTAAQITYTIQSVFLLCVNTCTPSHVKIKNLKLNKILFFFLKKRKEMSINVRLNKEEPIRGCL